MPGNAAQSIEQLYRQMRDEFRLSGLSQPELDARLLTAHSCRINPEQCITRHADLISPDQRARALESMAERLSGKSCARIIGYREFWKHRLLLDAHSFEPRPDSEMLVEAVLRQLEDATSIDNLRFADLCTGSGAIALALLHELPKAHAIVTDISLDTARSACKNLHICGFENRVLVACGDLCNCVTEGLDFIVANPPYIATGDIAGLGAEVSNFDPLIALDGGVDGLDILQAIVMRAGRCLVKGGSLFLEIGKGQAEPVERLLIKHGFGWSKRVKDLAGQDRVLHAIYL